jgi:D-amino peptidase
VVLSDPAADRDGTVRILVYHDMEGLAGQDDPRTFSYRNTEDYARGRVLLTDDVNAVIAGLFDGGADEVHVVDAHGSGNPEPDLLLDRTDPRAELVVRDAPFRQYVDLVEPDVYDAVAVVGMHAKTGSGGFASHTYTLGMDIVFNGASVTETELIGYSWGRVGVPVIFASGDDRLARDLETMPWLEFVTVKQATSASSASLRPLGEVRAELTAAAARAVGKRDAARVMTLTTPIAAGLRAVPPASLAPLEGVPGIAYAEGTVSFEAADFAAAYDGVIALIRVARGSYADLVWEALEQRGEAAEVRSAFVDALFARWLDVESGRWSPPSAAPMPPRQYHGAN